MPRRLEVKRSWDLGVAHVTYNWRSGDHPRGRFSGGWNWKVGAQAGGGEIILNFVIFTVRTAYRKDWRRGLEQWLWERLLPGPWCPGEATRRDELKGLRSSQMCDRMQSSEGD